MKRKLGFWSLMFFSIFMLAGCARNNEITETPINEKTYFQAIDKGDVMLAQRAVDSGVNINTQNEDNRTPLLYALTKNEPEIANMLISKGADVNIPDKNNEVPLTQCISNIASNEKVPENTDICKNLVQNGADVNYSKGEQTPLQLACTTNPDIVKLLVDNKANPNLSVETDNTMRGKPLFIAVNNNKTDIANILMNNGADPKIGVLNVENGIKQDNLLEVAVANGNKDMVQSLINKGCDVNTKDPEGNTCLNIAAQQQNKDMVDYLASKGAVVLPAPGTNNQAAQQYIAPPTTTTPGPTPPAPTAPGPSPQPPTQVPGGNVMQSQPMAMNGFQLVEYRVTDDGQFIIGTIKNSNGFDCPKVEVVAKMTDVNGNVVATPNSTIEVLKKGEMWSFKIPIPSDRNKEYKCSITEIKSQP